MKKANAELAMLYRRPLVDGLRTWCTMLGRTPMSVAAAVILSNACNGSVPEILEADS